MSTTSTPTTISPDNPLDPSPDHERRVSVRAYHLWEADGCPDGKADEYWERARELEAMASSAGAGLLPINELILVDEADLQDNLGEFPDRSSDQGERPQTPSRKSRRASRNGA